MNEDETTPEAIATSAHTKKVFTSTSSIYVGKERGRSTSDVDSRTVGENCDKNSLQKELNTSVASYSEHGDNTYAIPKNISGVNGKMGMKGVSSCANLPANRHLTAQPPDDDSQLKVLFPSSKRLESIASNDNDGEYKITKSISNKSPQPDIVNTSDIEDLDKVKLPRCHDDVIIVFENEKDRDTTNQSSPTEINNGHVLSGDNDGSCRAIKEVKEADRAPPSSSVVAGSGQKKLLSSRDDRISSCKGTEKSIQGINIHGAIRSIPQVHKFSEKDVNNTSCFNDGNGEMDINCNDSENALTKKNLFKGEAEENSVPNAKNMLLERAGTSSDAEGVRKERVNSSARSVGDEMAIRSSIDLNAVTIKTSLSSVKHIREEVSLISPEISKSDTSSSALNRKRVKNEVPLERKKPRTATLNEKSSLDLYEQFLSSTDTSLEDARRRLHTALEQTRAIREAFTQRVYEKYRVVLRPVEKSVEDIVRVSKTYPIEAYKYLMRRSDLIKQEKELEKKDALKLNSEISTVNKTGVSSLLGGVSGGVENMEQLSWFGAGLSLVILPEEDYTDEAELETRGISYRGPLDPLTGKRVDGLSPAAATAACAMLDRVRKSNELRLKRKRNFLSEDLDDPRAISVGQKFKHMPALSYARYGSTLSTTKSSNPTNNLNRVVGSKGRGKGNRSKPHNSSASNLLSLSPSVEGIGFSGKTCAAGSALMSSGVGITLSSKSAGKKATNTQKLRHPYPGSKAARSMSVGPNRTLGSVVLNKKSLALPPLIPVGKRKKQKPIFLNLLQNDAFNESVAINVVLKQFLAQDSDDDTQNPSRDCSSKHRMTTRVIPEVKLKRHMNRIGLLGNIRELPSHTLRNRPLIGEKSHGSNTRDVRPIVTDPLLSLSVLHAIGLVKEAPISMNDEKGDLHVSNINDVLNNRGSIVTHDEWDINTSTDFTEVWVGTKKKSIAEELMYWNKSFSQIYLDEELASSAKFDSERCTVVANLRGGGGEDSSFNINENNVMSENQDGFPISHGDQPLSSLTATFQQGSRPSSNGRSSSSDTPTLFHNNHLQSQRQKKEYMQAATLWGDQGRPDLTPLPSQTASSIHQHDVPYEMISQDGVHHEPVSSSLSQSLYSSQNDGITAISANPRMQGQQHLSLSHPLGTARDHFRHPPNSTASSRQLHVTHNSLKHATASLQSPIMHHSGDLIDYFSNSMHHSQPSSSYTTDWAALSSTNGLSVLPQHASLNTLASQQAVMMNLSMREGASAMLSSPRKQQQALNHIGVSNEGSSRQSPTRILQSGNQNLALNSSTLSTSHSDNRNSKSLTTSTPISQENDVAPGRRFDRFSSILAKRNHVVEEAKEGKRKRVCSASIPDPHTSVHAKISEESAPADCNIRKKEPAFSKTIIYSKDAKESAESYSHDKLTISEDGHDKEECSTKVAKEVRAIKETCKEQKTAIESGIENPSTDNEIKGLVGSYDSGSINPLPFEKNNVDNLSGKFKRPKEFSNESLSLSGNKQMTFMKPPPPKNINQYEVTLIVTGHFHLIEMGQCNDSGLNTNETKSQALINYLIAVGAAIPIPNAMITNYLNQKLDSSILKSLIGPMLSIQQAVCAVIIIWLWRNHNETVEKALSKRGCFEEDTRCIWLVNAAIDTFTRDLVDYTSKNPTKQKTDNVDSSARYDTTAMRIASLISRNLSHGLNLNLEMDAALPNLDEMLRHLEELRLCALRARSQERSMVASLVSRRTRMSESFSHAYTSAMIRAGEVFGYEDLCDIVQHEETVTSSCMPFDILNDSTGAWEDPCRPVLGFIPGVNGDELNKRAHSQALLQKSLKKLQDRHGIKGGTPNGGCYSTSGSNNSNKNFISPSKSSPLVSRSSGGLRRKSSHNADTLGNHQEFNSSLVSSLCNPIHYSSPFVWDSITEENEPFGRYEETWDSPSRIRLASDSRLSILSRSKKRQRSPGNEKSESLISEVSNIRSTQEIQWIDVAQMFQPVAINGNDRSSNSKMKSHEVFPNQKITTEGSTIFAPFCRKISGEEASESSDTDIEEDLSDYMMLQNHQKVLDHMKEKFDAMMVIRKQYQDRSRQRSSGGR